MAHKLCPIIPCITKNKSQTNCNVPTDDSISWDVLCPMDFCSEVFPLKNVCTKEPTDPKTCWYCHVENTARGKCVARKSNDPVPDEIRRLQEKLEFNPGEPVTKETFQRIIPTWRKKKRERPSKESTNQAKSSVWFPVAPTRFPPNLKRKCEKSGASLLKKYANDRLIFAAFLLLFTGYTSGKLYTVKDCGKASVPQSRIVDGEVSKRGKYPWMVSIWQSFKGKLRPICGGAILNENWIVTAAHCFDQPIEESEYEVFVGLFSLKKTNENTVQNHKLSKIIIHEDYDETGFHDDIALIKTSTPIDIKGSKGYVNGICLPSGVTNPDGDAIVAGWGTIYDDGPLSAELREVTVPIVPWKTCKQIYESKHSAYEFVQVTPFVMCAGGNGKDSCQGDSGGPLFQFDKNGVATLIGTVANGGDCGNGHYPGMYMKASAYKSWMDRVMT